MRNKIRKLIQESIENYVPGATLEGINLYCTDEEDPDQIELALYKTDPSKAPGSENSTIIIAYFRIEPTFLPCVENSEYDTWHITSIYTNPTLRSLGYGKLIYDLAFYLAQKNGHSLTSDRNYGSKDKAYDIWDKILSSPEYNVKSTASGNSIFDYDSSTPDPYDDCDKSGNNAADYTVVKIDVSGAESAFNLMKSKHELHVNNLKSFMSDPEIDGYLELILMRADEFFSDAYDQSKFKSQIQERKRPSLKEVLTLDDGLNDVEFQPDDLKLYGFVKKDQIKSIMYHGMPGIEAVINNEELLNEFYPNPDDQSKIKKIYSKKNMKLKGPMVFFQLPDLEKIRQIDPDHSLVSGHYSIVEIDYDNLNDSQDYDGIYGLDLLMYDSLEKERMLTPGDVNDLSVMPFDNAWKHYVPGSFAKNVPHGVILTDSGVVDTNFLKIHKETDDEL